MKTLKTLAYPIAAGMMFTSASGCRAATFAESLNDGTVTVRVVDDTDVPLEGVQAIMYSLSDEGTSKLGLTDTNGMYSVQLRKIYAEIDGHFTKPGYYKSNGVFWKWDKWGGVPPANTNFTIVLKRITEPVQMKKIEVNAVFPRLNEPVGFDLAIGDWIFPDGKGEIADILFTTEEGYYVSDKNFAIRASAKFPNEYDGIQSFHVPSRSDAPTQLLRSELQPPLIAPKSGYEKTFEHFSHRLPSEKRSSSSYDNTRRWIYRTRTEVNKDGEIVSANYGWFSMDMSIGPFGKTGRIMLHYYHNPDPKSRSLEPKEIADRQAKDMPKDMPKETQE